MDSILGGNRISFATSKMDEQNKDTHPNNNNNKRRYVVYKCLVCELVG